MNEAETRAELIDPQLKEAGWGVVKDSSIRREYKITDGTIKGRHTRGDKKIADYILIYKKRKLAVVEAKPCGVEVNEGVQQAKTYAQMLELDTAFAANGREIYQICRKTHTEGQCDTFPSPDELWQKTHSSYYEWQARFDNVPFRSTDPNKTVRYYQELAVNHVMHAIAKEQKRILLTLATGTGKTFIAAQIAWKLFQSRWSLKMNDNRPRILFLTDRNFLADQAYLSFDTFSEDALNRITPDSIRKKGAVPKNASVFFTIFQTFTSGEGEQKKFYYYDYEQDFFDFIIIDECHRGGANDESRWHEILKHFAPAVQLGLTATPKRENNVDTYEYFGKPVFTYSLKQGIQDGFLTPFKVKHIQTTLDEYNYESDDKVLQGEVEKEHTYTEHEFNRKIEIKERERKRVRILLGNIDKDEKTIVFCVTQHHAALIRDFINQETPQKIDDYCVRITADEGIIGENYLEKFKDNERTIPTIVTTSRKLSTGVDVPDVRNIVLMSPVESMIEFKQFIGRGTRVVYPSKYRFTIIDFVNACKKFNDKEWDGDPVEEEETSYGNDDKDEKKNDKTKKRKTLEDGKTDSITEKVRVKLADGKEANIESTEENNYLVDGELMDEDHFREYLLTQLQWKQNTQNQTRTT